MASIYHRHRRQNPTDPFIDLLFNTLLGFSFLFLVSLLFIHPEADNAKVFTQAEYMITISWDEELADDIDLWVHAPTGHTVSYLQKEAGWLHLDRDDRGVINDTIMVDGKEVVHKVNEEVVTVRFIIEGEYIANLYYFHAASQKPVAVKFRVDRINPKFQTVYADTIELAAQDQEVTAIRFTLDEEGNPSDFNKLPLRLTPYALDHIPEHLWTN